METSLCNCNQTPETAIYLAIEYQETTEERQRLNIEISNIDTYQIQLRSYFEESIDNRKVMKWILKLGYLYQYKLAIYIGGESEKL